MGIRGTKMGLKLCEALGLDPARTTHIVVDLPAAAAVTVTVTSFLDGQQGTTFADVFAMVMDGDTETKRYEIVEVAQNEVLL